MKLFKSACLLLDRLSLMDPRIRFILMSGAGVQKEVELGLVRGSRLRMKDSKTILYGEVAVRRPFLIHLYTRTAS